MRHFLLALLITGMVGCAETGVQPAATAPDYPAWKLRQQELQKIQSWDLIGRLAIKTDKDGWSVTINWKQRPDAWQLRLIAPLNQGTYQLQGNDEKVILQTPENRMFRAKSPEVLLQHSLGWSVPFDGLKYWIRGIPEPDKPIDNIVVDNDGRMVDLQQAGWHITITRYETAEKPELPEKLQMINDRFQLRLVVQQWQHTR